MSRDDTLMLWSGRMDFWRSLAGVQPSLHAVLAEAQLTIDNDMRVAEGADATIYRKISPLQW